MKKSRSILGYPDLCLLIALVSAYMLFFVYPVFLNPERTMKFLPYIVKIDPIGLDLAQMLDYSRAWFLRGQSPYIGANPYPPPLAVSCASRRCSLWRLPQRITS